LDRVELGQPVLVHRREDVALAAVLWRSGGTASAHLGQATPRLVAQVVEPGVEPGQICLFALDLGRFAASQPRVPFAKKQSFRLLGWRPSAPGSFTPRDFGIA